MERGRNDKRKKVFLFGMMIALVWSVIGFGIFMLFHKQEPDGTTKVEVVEHQKSEEKITKKYEIFDEVLHIGIQEQMNLDASGKIVNGYLYENGYYLIISKKNDKSYSKEFPGDRIIWAKEEKGEVAKQELTNGDFLVSLVTKKNEPKNPFLKYNNKTYFVFYEREGLIEQGVNKKGYVYEVMKDGKIKKVFETTGVFGGIKETKEKELVILDKQFLEDRGMYPTSLKPYELYYTKITSESNEIMKKETKKPAEEKIDEIDFSQEFQPSENETETSINP